MKIDREDINKLKQEDRIEFYLKANHLDLIKPEFPEFPLILSVLFLLLALITLLFLSNIYTVYGEEYESNIYFIISGLKIAKLIIYGLAIYSVVDYFIKSKKHNKKYEELEREFFEVK